MTRLSDGANRGSGMLLGSLLMLWAFTVIARVTLFAGGGAGSLLDVILFWLVSVVLMGLSVQGLRISGGPKIPYALVLVGLLAFIYRVAVPTGVLAEISTGLWLLCILGLLGVFGKELIEHRKRPTSS